MTPKKRLGLGLLLSAAIVLPFIFSTGFQRNLFVLSLIFAIAALSLDLIFSKMGQLSFGHQAFFALGAYASAIITVRLEVSPFLGILAGAAAAGFAGMVIGYVALRSTRGPYLAVVTLGFAVILFQIFSYFKQFTGGRPGISEIPSPVISLPWFQDIVFKTDLSYYFFALFFLVLTIYLISRWEKSRFGRASMVLGQNETLAESVGISPLRVYTMTFALSSAIAGLSGALFAHYLRFISPQLFELSYMIKFAVILFVGGSGTYGGPVLGAFIFVLLPELLPTSQEYDLVGIGIILLLFILFMPKGVYPSLVSLGKKLIYRLSEYKTSGSEISLKADGSGPETVYLRQN